MTAAAIRLRHRLSPFDLLSAFCAAFIVVLILYPAMTMLVRVFMPDGQLDLSAFGEVLGQPWLWPTLLNTLVIVAAAGFFALLTATMFAWLNERTDARLGLVGDILPIVPLLGREGLRGLRLQLRPLLSASPLGDGDLRAGPEGPQAVTVLGRRLLTLRQIEACYWSGHLGSFVAAARRLNTTQSSISKRILELEDALGFAVFDRSKRAIRLTQRVAEAVRLCESLLRTHMDLASLAEAEPAISGKFRLGVTESVANTWLAAHLGAIRDANPAIVPEPQVGTSLEIREALQRREIDLAIGGDLGIAADTTQVSLAKVRQVAVCSAGFGLAGRRISLDETARLPLIGPRLQSEWHLLIEKAFLDRRIPPNIIAYCASPRRGCAWRRRVWASPSCRETRSCATSRAAGWTSSTPSCACPTSIMSRSIATTSSAPPRPGSPQWPSGIAGSRRSPSGISRLVGRDDLQDGAVRVGEVEQAPSGRHDVLGRAVDVQARRHHLGVQRVERRRAEGEVAHAERARRPAADRDGRRQLDERRRRPAGQAQLDRAPLRRAADAREPQRLEELRGFLRIPHDDVDVIEVAQLSLHWIAPLS